MNSSAINHLPRFGNPQALGHPVNRQTVASHPPDVFSPIQFGVKGDPKTIAYYRANASKLTNNSRNAAIDAPENSISSRFDEAFEPLGNGAKIMDIGSGSGHEMQILTLLGYDVHGLEPVEELRRITQQSYPELKGRVSEGALPFHLPLHLQQKFDGVLCAGTLEHIPKEQLPASIDAIKSLLKGKGGRVLLSMPFGRKGYNPATGRDETGRLVREYMPEEFSQYFEKAGFKMKAFYGKNLDPAKRQLEWHNYIFELQ